MAKQIYIGFIGEGTTDDRFLTEIANKTFTDIAFECRGDVSIEEVVCLKRIPGEFVERMSHASKQAYKKGLSVLCIQADADKKTIKDVYENKITPLNNVLEELNDGEYCKNIVPMIPITETESWMLADKELLKQRINASDKSDNELGIHQKPETYTHPKEVIENAIRIAQQDNTKRRRKTLTIVYYGASLHAPL